MFYSILYPTEKFSEIKDTEPSCFADINLDQIINPICMDNRNFHLEPYFYSPVSDVDTVRYRQEVLRDTEDAALCEIFKTLSARLDKIAEEMYEIGRKMQVLSPEMRRENYAARGMLIDCVDNYCDVVTRLKAAVRTVTFNSAGMRGFVEYLDNYTESKHFAQMRERISNLRASIKTIKFNMYIKDNSISVRKNAGEERYSDKLLSMLEKFRQKEVDENYLRVIPEGYLSEKTEASIFKLVMQEFKGIFGEIDAFCDQYSDFVDETIVRVVREIRFYVAWHSFIEPLKEAGLEFCYPSVLDKPGDIYAKNSFDLALASMKRGDGIITNDFELKSPEHIIVITGPNQGGKTTFARMFGQTHYLAALGLSVPGCDAQLFLCDKVLTHFGKQESLEMQSGQLQDDLIRLKAVFDAATTNSILIINEIFASTTLKDALELGRRMMDKITALNAPALVITFIDELAEHGRETISMVSAVQKDDPVKRTYKIVRKKPDGLAFAIHLARKRGMTYEQIISALNKGGEDSD